MLTDQDQARLLPLKRAIVDHFTADNWLELGALTNSLALVQGHDRLFRAMRFNDDDYPAACFQVILSIVGMDPQNLGRMEAYVAQNVQGGGTSASSANGPTRIYITPTVFEVPDTAIDPSLVAVMMPFGPSFNPVYEAIKQASAHAGLTCQRASDIWNNAVIIQDIFALIYRANIVVCDFSGKNPNVFYEAGIAHTLGKHVVPITQHQSDVPFDIQHHRYVSYLNNQEGLAQLTYKLHERFSTLAGRSFSWTNS